MKKRSCHSAKNGNPSQAIRTRLRSPHKPKEYFCKAGCANCSKEFVKIICSGSHNVSGVNVDYTILIMKAPHF